MKHPRSSVFAFVLALLSAPLVAGCGGDEAVAPAPKAPVALVRRPVSFSYATLDGGTLTPESLAGRHSLIAFIALFDTASQAQAQLLLATYRSHTPRTNLAFLVLEPEEHRVLAEAFVEAFGVQVPVAFADAETIAGRGPFAGLNQVPSLVVLDRAGREVARHVGLLDRAGIVALLHEVEAADPL